MADLDMDGVRLEKGFYLDTHSSRVYYFTGEYSRNGHAICENVFGSSPNTSSVTETFRRIANPRSFLEVLSSNGKFMQYKILQLEQAAASAQSPAKCADIRETIMQGVAGLEQHAQSQPSCTKVADEDDKAWREYELGVNNDLRAIRQALEDSANSNTILIGIEPL